jgi:hypothetical protein
MRSLWASIQGNPVFMRKLNGWLTMHWIMHFPVVIVIYFVWPDTWAKISILYLALVSIYANVAGHLSAWQAARIEVAQNDQDIPRDVVARLREEPDVPL